jgi:HAD superfamily hydrolase (TIGR01484 family)
MKKLYLFDVDGTLAEPSKKITHLNSIYLEKLRNQGNVEIGIVGGGKLDKILEQTSGILFDHYFAECGCVYKKLSGNYLEFVYEKNIREHSLYKHINILIKCALKFLSEVDYELTGNFIDLRCGIIYISLIGLSANDNEREYFKNLDKSNQYRKKLLDILRHKAVELNVYNKIHIVYGGSVGIAIYPSEYDKKQVMNYINIPSYSEIHYFGDKYQPDGNDYLLLNHEKVIGHRVDGVLNTYELLKNIVNN